jgi:ribonuclease P protein component
VPVVRVAKPSRASVLSGKAAFDGVFAARQKRNSRYFRFHYADNALDHARLGMAVSRRVDKRSVVRNRLRRQIRQSFRLALPALPSLDIVVNAKPEAAQATRGDLWRDLVEAWPRLAR